MLMASGTAEEFAVASSGAAAQPALSSAVAEAAKRRDERISKRDAVEHEKHRMRGHFPYDPTCVQCQQSRGVHRHPRQRQKPLEPRIFADFFDIAHENQRQEHKFLALVEVASGMIGAVPCSTDRRATNAVLAHWLSEFAMPSKMVELFTDAETAVGNLFKSGLESGLRVLVRKAGPQNHETVGAVEQTVRRFKEGAATIRVDLREEGVDICPSHDSWFHLLKYVAFAHNCFACPGEGAKTAREKLANRQLPTATFAMYGSVVLAEAPESVPAPARFVKACYLSPQWNSLGHTVVTTLDGSKKVFTAKSIKPVTPLEFDVSLAVGFLTNPGLPKQPKLDEGPARPYEGPIQPGPVTLSGNPPAAFFNEHGRTPGCNACSFRTLGGRVHNKACKERYRKFLELEQKQLSSDKEPPAEQVGPSIAPAPNDPLSDFEPSDWFDEAGNLKDAETTTVPSTEVSPPAPPVRRLNVKTSPAELVGKGQKRPAEDAPDSSAGSGEPLTLPVPAMPDFDMASEEPLSVPMEVDSLLDISTMTDSSDGLTGPELLDPNVFQVSGVLFESSSQVQSKTIKFCGSKLKVWKPSAAVSDVTMAHLDGEATFKGMLRELAGLDGCKAGRPMSKEQADAYCTEHGISVLASRWVTNEKEDTDGAEIVRSRLVVKDFRGSKSARSLEISSPTPSVEALRTILAYAGRNDWELASLDVSQAFMHTPLKQRKACVKLPLSVSFPNGEPVYMALDQALNGLRISSRAWLEYITTDTLGPLGLRACEREPCLFSGLVDGVECLVLLYVDDVLIACPDRKVIDKIFAAFQSKVPTKLTGRVFGSKGGGGHLRFLGRNIERRPGETTLTLFVDASYLDSCYDDYKLSGRGSGSAAFPDIRAILEKSNSPVLSAEAHARFRRVLGKLAWFAQTREDLHIAISLVSVGQSVPTAAHEEALRALLRFLRRDGDVRVHFPSPETLSSDSFQEVSVFSDASYAPMRTLGRKSITGGVIILQGSLIKALARQQASVTLSSCEAELHAIQTMTQESLVILHVVHRILSSFQWLSKAEWPYMQLSTDSESARVLLMGADLPKRSRHIEIRVFWLREMISKGYLRVTWGIGTENPADLFTKCLPMSLFVRHRRTLGFLPHDGPSVQALLSSD